MRKTEKKVFRRKTSNRRTKKQRKNNRKKTVMKGGFDIVPVIKDYLNKKIQKTECENKSCNLITSSKSDQIINICNKWVYKQPPSGYNDFKDIEIEWSNKGRGYRIIKVNPHTMNLFIQSVFNDHNVADVEKYNKICFKDGKPAMEGNKYEFDTGINSLTDYITKTTPDPDAEIIKTQMVKICNKLDELYNNFQFHHCDPKTDQIFLNGSNFILGDLDKVTFSVKYTDDNKKEHYYRVRLSTLDATKRSIGSKFRSVGLRGGRSISEMMRFEDRPRAHCDFEKCAFIASLMLSANEALYKQLTKRDNDGNPVLIDDLLNCTNSDNAVVDMGKVQEMRNNTKDKKLLKGHSVATQCVKLINTEYANEIKSDFDLSTPKPKPTNIFNLFQ
jgi:hypothetical protein